MEKEFIEMELTDDFISASFNRVYKSLIELLPKDINKINAWLGGGCFVRAFSGEKLSDIDFYASNRNDLYDLVRVLRKNGFKIYFINGNAIKGYVDRKDGRINVDVVKKCFPTEIDTIKNFDFSVTKIIANPSTNKAYYYQSAFIDILQKRLVLPHDLPAPIGTLKRMQKYIRRGFVACDGTMIKLARSINSLDLNDPIQNPIEFYPDGRQAIPKWD